MPSRVATSPSGSICQGWPRARRERCWGRHLRLREPPAASGGASAAPPLDAADRAVPSRPPSTRPIAAAPCFADCPAAAKHLGARWSLLQQEGRFGQLAWEAERICGREPSWVPARSTLIEALLASRRFAEARSAAEAGIAQGGKDVARWKSLREHVATLQESNAVAGTPLTRSSPGTFAGRRLVVASAFCGSEFEAKMRPARENHERWCALHGYTYACLEENIAGREDPTWSKIPHVLRLLREGAEHVFWMDADSLFINDGADLEWACDLGKDFVFAGDLNVVFNAGHFLARRGAWAERLLEDAFRIHPWPEWEDNGALMIMLGGGSADDPSTWRPAFERMKVATRSQHECDRAMKELLPPEVASHVAVVPQHRLNSYEWPGGGGVQAVARGDPILHFAGCSSFEKVGLVVRFAGADGDPGVLLRLCGGGGSS